MGGPHVLFIAATAAMFYSLSHYEVWSFGVPGPGLMPLVGCAVIMLACGWVAFANEPLQKPAFSYAPAIYAAGFIILVPLTFVVGLLPALALVAVGTLRLVDGVSLTRSVIIAASIAAGSWLLFQRVLMVPLPTGIVWGF